jgi:hypothetical protein
MQSDPSHRHSATVSAWCVVATFGAYFCMYGFRKPFTVAEYEGALAWGLAYKPLAIVSQVLGYMISKFIGIKIIAELDPRRRVSLLLMLIGIAQAALLGFAVMPAPWNIVWLFVNGMPLGMVFGLVLGALEGRRHTEGLAAGLCTSFIVADGVTKAVGSRLLAGGVSEFWMPAASGSLFVVPLLFFAWMMARIPPPSAHDIAARSARTPMNRAERRQFFGRYGLGLTLLVAMFLLVTILRSIRSDFAPEIWKGLGVDAQAGHYAWTEILVAVGVLALNGSAVLIAGNRRAFFFAMSLAIVGPAMVLAAPLALRAGLSPFAFVVLQGLGLYLPYIAVHTTIFERLIAMTRDRSNIGYLMYLADAFGYLGYVAVLIWRNVAPSTGDFFDFYQSLSVAVSTVCIVAMIPCWQYFASHPATQRDPQQTELALPPAVDPWDDAEVTA